LIVGGTYTSQSQLNISNNLCINSSKSISLGGNVKTWNYFKNGTTTLNGYTVTVNNNQASSITTSVPADTSFNWKDSFAYDVNSFDREGETQTFATNSTLSGASMNATSGEFAVTYPPGGNGTYYISLSVSDGNHTTYQNISIYIENEAPEFSTRYDTYSDCEEIYLYDANATDPESEDIVYTLVTDCEFLTIDANGVVSGTPLESDSGSWNIAICADDGYSVAWQNYTLIIRNSSTSFMFELGLYFSIQIFLFCVIIVGYFRVPFLLFIGLIGSVVLAIPTILGFGSYYMIGVVLILMNVVTPAMGLARNYREK
jgi:hypothetical protein